MMIKIEEVNDPVKWENFLLSQKITPFFQSWWWGEMQKQLGFPVLRLGIKEKDGLVGIAQIIKIEAKRGTFLWIRHGPVFEFWQWSWFDCLLNYLTNKTNFRKGVTFIRIAPPIDETRNIRQQFEQRNFRLAPIHNIDAENALVIDLYPVEEQLLKNMRKSTRYLIRKSIEEKIKVEQTTDVKKLSNFLSLYRKTANRQGFVPHKGLQEELSILGKKDMIRLFLAYYKGELAAGAMIVFYGKEAVYHHSAMRADLRHLPLSYRLQWEAIKEAKRQGMRYYNLWGVAPKDKPNHPWQGLTLFKRGFGGQERRYVHAQDLPLSKKYWFTWVIETVRRIKRRY